MSSTNINVGLLEGRNSSRVLKPPGGGHSQIFGNAEDEKPRPKVKHQNSSEINACFTHDEPLKDKEKQDEQKKENVAEPVPDVQPAEEKMQPTPQRIRVPPGGYSSGFW